MADRDAKEIFTSSPSVDWKRLLGWAKISSPANCHGLKQTTQEAVASCCQWHIGWHDDKSVETRNITVTLRVIVSVSNVSVSRRFLNVSSRYCHSEVLVSLQSRDSDFSVSASYVSFTTLVTLTDCPSVVLCVCVNMLSMN